MSRCIHRRTCPDYTSESPQQPVSNQAAASLSIDCPARLSTTPLPAHSAHGNTSPVCRCLSIDAGGSRSTQQLYAPATVSPHRPFSLAKRWTWWIRIVSCDVDTAHHSVYDCLFVFFYLYPVAWGPKGHGSGGLF